VSFLICPCSQTYFSYSHIATNQQIRHKIATIRPELVALYYELHFQQHLRGKIDEFLVQYETATEGATSTTTTVETASTTETAAETSEAATAAPTTVDPDALPVAELTLADQVNEKLPEGLPKADLTSDDKLKKLLRTQFTGLTSLKHLVMISLGV
jgi:hypothetical protein